MGVGGADRERFLNLLALGQTLDLLGISVVLPMAVGLEGEGPIGARNGRLGNKRGLIATVDVSRLKHTARQLRPLVFCNRTRTDAGDHRNVVGALHRERHHGRQALPAVIAG